MLGGWGEGEGTFFSTTLFSTRWRVEHVADHTLEILVVALPGQGGQGKARGGVIADHALQILGVGLV